MKFKHSGEIGDIVLSLPVIRYLSEEPATLYLALEENSQDDHLIDMPLRFNKQAFEFIKPLLEAQEYIKEVTLFKGQDFDVNLNKFRTIREDTLQKKFAGAHNVPLDKWLDPYISVLPREPEYPYIVVSRTSSRYRGSSEMYKRLYKVIKNYGVFIGTDEEYQTFCNDFGFDEFVLKRIIVENALDVATALKGAMFYVGSGSSICNIAYGVGTFVIQEFCKTCLNPFMPHAVGVVFD